MAKTCKIIRKSIFSFFQNYQYYISTPTLLAFPYAAAYLLTQSLLPSSHLFPLIRIRLVSLFLSAGFPPSSQLFAILNLKLSQTTLTFIFVFPFTISFLLLARASVIKKTLDGLKKPVFFSWTSLFNLLLITQLCNSLVILAANATCFFFLALCFNFFDIFGLSSSQGPLLFLTAAGAVIYSIIVANFYIICSLALVSSGMENRSGFISILKACVTIQGRTATALSLAVAMNLALAAIEALFRYRIVRAFRGDLAPNWGLLITEGIFIASLYAVFLVLDTVVGCTFWKSCKEDDRIYQYFHQIEIQGRDGKCFTKTYKALDITIS